MRAAYDISAGSTQVPDIVGLDCSACIQVAARRIGLAGRLAFASRSIETAAGDARGFIS